MDTTEKTIETTETTTRKGFVRRIAKGAAILAAVAVALSACNNADQDEVRTLVNDTRQANGLKSLAVSNQATDKAQAWADKLAAQGSLEHSNLPSGITANWKSIGENVGHGPSIASVHQGYMASPGHRANILDKAYTHIGTGVAHKDGRVYTVQVFLQL